MSNHLEQICLRLNHSLALAAILTKQYIHNKPPHTVHALIDIHISTIYIYLYSYIYRYTEYIYIVWGTKKSCGSIASDDKVTLNLKIQQHSCSGQNTFYSWLLTKRKRKEKKTNKHQCLSTFYSISASTLTSLFYPMSWERFSLLNEKQRIPLPLFLILFLTLRHSQAFSLRRGFTSRF